MDKKDLVFFQSQLEKQKQELINNVGITVENMSSTKESFPDPTDRATQEEERSFELRIRDRENKLIKKIDQALKRIEDGSYGVCEGCGEEISKNRLLSRPVTTKCIVCKTKEEQAENAIEK